MTPYNHPRYKKLDFDNKVRTNGLEGLNCYSVFNRALDRVSARIVKSVAPSRV